MEFGFNCWSIHFARPIFLMRSMSPGRGPYARRFSACRMASSALNSVIGNPFSDGSCLGFLSPRSAAAGAANAGKSTPRERQQETERKAARKDLGVVEMEKWRVAARGFRLMTLSNEAARSGKTGLLPAWP